VYKYKINVTRVVDGDTVDADIDLGFGMTYKKQRIRLMGIDTPESRTRDLTEKFYGKLSKQYLKDILSLGEVRLVSHDKGKFGRILGELFVMFDGDVEVNVNQKMIEEGHAVAYHGENKDLVEQNHMKNRQKLAEKGLQPE